MRTLLLLLSVLVYSSAFSQFSFTYNPTDSTYTNGGGWSFVKMYSQKDSTANPDSYFLKSYHRNFHFMNNTIKKSSDIAGNYLVVDSITGKLSSSKIIPITRVTGVSGSYIAGILGYTPYSSSNPAGYITGYTETDPLFDSKFSGKSTSNLAEGSNLYFTNTRSRLAISLTTIGTSGASTYNNSTGVLNIPQYTAPSYTAGSGISVSSNVISNTDYYNTGTTTSGQVVFYLTSDKTSSGTLLYSTIDYVSPIVNNADLNYSFGWSYNSGTGALTVTAKSASGINVALLGLTLLGVPQNVTNGTSVQILVKGH